MSLSLYQASIPLFTQILGGLSAVLRKAEAHATDKKIDPNALLQARLFPDMFPLTRQVQIAADFAKGAAARLAGVDVPAYEDSEVSFADLQARIAKTLAFIHSVPAADIDAGVDRSIVLRAGTPNEKTFVGTSYLLNYTLPHFFFHTTTAYDILRHNGVEVGKKDFVGSY
ncbi:hypothetical protein SAMN05216303_1011427 [Rhodoferax sp. OV413]|uniref:DUF1993 domain-containing protein n=1 Tax=Rhodoferax sp. OV413 TaxID=1855285 RepID=UPI00087F11DB|nr:DUF1993 domain-containing protein [Rhodoferax sp. OV413]SDO44392.1 hypothetical protein SAMN05216303_1011427 [Rhodoferax sp. OV413]